MPRYGAFLRAINVGRRRVTMAVLARHVADAGARDVTTILASGTLVLSDRRGPAAVRAALERHLGATLGFDVPVMLRTADELEELLGRVPYPPAVRRSAHALFVGFAGALLPPEAAARLGALASATDDLHVAAREVWWLRRRQVSATGLDTAAFERAAGTGLTFRTVATVERVRDAL